MGFYPILFSPVDAGTGLPLSGLSPSFSAYFNAVALVSVTPPPINPVPGFPIYSTVVDQNACGMVFFGSAGGNFAAPQYEFVEAVNATTFPLFDLSGNPLTGQQSNLSWLTLLDNSTGAAPVATPAFYELGGGCYLVQNWKSTYFGKVYCSGPTGTSTFDLGLPQTVSAPPAPAPTPPTPPAVGGQTGGNVTPGVYGIDVRTFVPTPLGLDVDPFLLFVSNPQIIMVEAIWRRLSMARGQLSYAPNAGYSLQNLVNSAQTQQQLNAQASLIQQELLKDPRIASANVVCVPSGRQLQVSITGVGAAGPFAAVFGVGSLTVALLSFS